MARLNDRRPSVIHVHFNRECEQRHVFISPEAKADATVETDLSAMQPVAAVDFADVVQFVKDKNLADLSCDTDAFWAGAAEKCWDEPGSSWHDKIRPAYEEYRAAIKTLAATPQTVTMPTGKAESKGKDVSSFVFKPQMIKRGTHRWHSSSGIVIGGRDDSAEWTAAAREEISVKWQKRDDLDAAMTKECRAALAKLREWPRCKDHDAPMAVKCCLPYGGNGKRYAFAGCLELGCPRTSTPVEIELTGPTGRAVGDESWIAPEFRT